MCINLCFEDAWKFCRAGKDSKMDSSGAKTDQGLNFAHITVYLPLYEFYKNCFPISFVCDHGCPCEYLGSHAERVRDESVAYI